MKKTIDYGLLIGVVFVTLFGAYMILSATYYFNIFDESRNPLNSFISDFQKIGLGLLVMIFAAFLPIKLIKKMAPLLMLISMGLLVLTLIVGENINGANRWLNIGPLSFAPSEVAKIVSVLYFAQILDKMQVNEKNYQRAWLSVILFGGLSVGLIFLQQDLSTPVIYAVSIGGMLFVAGSKLRHLLLVITIGVIAASGAIMTKDYRMQRVEILFTDHTDISNNAAQANQSLMAIAEGQIIGVGPGKAYQTKYGLSYSNSDFIFATVAETTGFVGSLVLISAYLFILWRMARIALLSNTKYGALVTTGVMTMFGFQAGIHLLVNAKLFPVTGVTLPLISSGGTSTIIILGGIGLVLNLSSNPKSLNESKG